MYKYYLVEFVGSFCMFDDWYLDRFIFNFIFYIKFLYFYINDEFFCDVEMEMIYIECLLKFVFFWGGGGVMIGL